VSAIEWAAELFPFGLPTKVDLHVYGITTRSRGGQSTVRSKPVLLPYSARTAKKISEIHPASSSVFHSATKCFPDLKAATELCGVFP
jgi:hypothetical protein